ncbi:MAG: glycosyltransferase family 1 protein [bacterium]|nr:glycosyltransferase family 1 protein [bacterium]
MSNKTIIGIDIRILVLGRRTGVEEYLINLLPRMVEQNPDVTFRLFYNAWHKPAELKAYRGFDFAKWKNAELCEFSIPNRFALFPLNALLHWPKIDRLIGGCDVFWSPHIFNAAISPGTRHVVTVHDLAFERYPEYFSLGKRLWHTMLMRPKTQLEGADHLITPSHSTASDLQTLYKIPASKITVIHPGVGEEFRPVKPNPADPSLRAKYRLPERFILYFGTIEPRKNIGGLIRAFEILKSTESASNHSVTPSLRHSVTSQLKLVVAGSPGWLYEDVYKAAKKSSFASDIIFPGFIAEEDTCALYNLADVFVYPSFFEGFGFPPLEAMACGVAVITSNRSSLPEVVGNAAIVINPDKPGEIADALQVALHDSATRQILITQGITRARTFSWNACATKTMECLLHGVR